jgi:hypothetical protein
MNSMLTPPPERDLPDHVGIRHRVVLAAQPHRREHDSGRRLVPVAAAAGVVLVGGVAALAGSGWLAAGSGVTTGSPGQAIPAAADAVARQCLRPLPPPSPDPIPIPDPARARVLAKFSDTAGAIVVVGWAGAGGGVATCDLDRAGRAVAANRPALQSDLQAWASFDPARQPIVIDTAYSRAGVIGDRTSGPDLPGIHAVAGQVAPGVTRVVATWSDGHHVTATIHDGVYAAREVIPRQGSDLPVLTVTVRAFDAHGTLLGTARGGDLTSASPTSPGG